MKRVAQKLEKVDLKGQRCYVGVDVHKSTYYVALLSEDGLRLEFSTPADPRGLLAKLNGLGIEILALAHETGPTGYELAWCCQDFGIKVIVAAASKIPRPITAGGKTDRLDAIKLAEYLAKGMLRSIAIPTRQEHGLRELERRRQQLVFSRMKLRQNLKSFLLKNSLREVPGLKDWTKRSMKTLRELRLEDKYLQLTLDSYLNQLEFVIAEIEMLKTALSTETAKQGKSEVIKNLKTIPGIGEIISHTFVTEVFRPERFERGEELSAYVGLAPIISQSGQSSGRARISKVGQMYLRSVLVEAAWISVRKDGYFRKVYNKIRSKTNVAQKAIVAVARKLLIVMWRVAVENRPYRPVAG